MNAALTALLLTTPAAAPLAVAAGYILTGLVPREAPHTVPPTAQKETRRSQRVKKGAAVSSPGTAHGASSVTDNRGTQETPPRPVSRLLLPGRAGATRPTGPG